MRALLVTSRLTLTPTNTFLFLQEVLDVAGEHVAGLLLLDNFDREKLAEISRLYRAGARWLAFSLLLNTLSLLGRRRENLFAQRGIPVLRFPGIDGEALLGWVQAHEIDLIVSAYTEGAFGERIRKAPRLGCIQLHQGLLPEERGAFCDLFALAEDKPAGFSIHVMADRPNDGPILVQRIVAQPGEKDYLAYLKRASREEGWALGELLLGVAKENALPAGEANATPNPIYRSFRGTREEVRWLQQRRVRI